MSDTWIEPVFDRTQSDVNYVLALNKKINESGFTSLTSDEQTAWLNGLKGALNYWDLNRIESNSEYLKERLIERGYNVTTDTFNTAWTMKSFPRLINMERARLNALSVSNRLFPNISPYPPDLEKPTFNDINDIERALNTTKEAIDSLDLNKHYCGSVFTGNPVLLPE